MQNEFSWTFRRCSSRKSEWLDRTPSWVVFVKYSKPWHTAFWDVLHPFPFSAFLFPSCLLSLSCSILTPWGIRWVPWPGRELWWFGFKHLCGPDCLSSFQNPPRSPCTQLALNQVKPLPVSAAVLKLACSDLLLAIHMCQIPCCSFLVPSSCINPDKMQVWRLLVVYHHRLLIFRELWGYLITEFWGKCLWVFGFATWLFSFTWGFRV